MRRFFAIALLFASVSAYASPVAVVATGTFNSYDDPNNLLPFSQPGEFSAFVLTFTYDGETPDVNPNARIGEYRGAISNIRLSIAGNTLQPFSDNWVVVLDDNGNPLDGYSDVWLASSFNEGPIRSSFGLVLLNIGGNAVASDALAPPSWPFPPYGFGFIDYSIEDRSSPDFSKWITLASASATVTDVAVVPLPGAFWLLSTGCHGLMGWRSRQGCA